jgi:acyl-CoA hydrolase
VTTLKNTVDHVVTEYGVAELRGRSLSDRAARLIAIAHPAFRDELERGARKPACCTEPVPVAFSRLARKCERLGL